MAEQKRIAVVTGANKGIGFGISKLLASNGITVILTARDEKRGLEAVQKLKDSGLSDFVLFHQLDVADSASIAVLAEFIKSKFGKLDILVNNAGVSGVQINAEALKTLDLSKVKPEEVDWSKYMSQTYESTEDCMKINYYGSKKMTDALVPLLELSDSPKIVNVSSSIAKLENIPYPWAKDVLGDVDNLTGEKIDEIVNRCLEEFKKGSPPDSIGYIISKACVNAYARIAAKKYPKVRINCVCPGFVKTDINFNTGAITADEAAEFPVALALNDGPSGCFYVGKEKSTF